LRLPAVERGRLPSRLFYAVFRLIAGQRAPDVIRTIQFRPAFFGRAFNRLTQRSLRGPSAWSVGERELFAAFVADRNKCRF
jgi:hypothetical protein